MSFTAEFFGGPLDGVKSLVMNPPLPPDAVWGFRCLGRCQLAALLRSVGGDHLAPGAAEECREQRCHLLAGPESSGTITAVRYRRTGTVRNAHQYELDEDGVAPGGAIFSKPSEVPVA